MRRKQNQKLYHTLILSALAFITLCSFKANAQELPIYKCINPTGQVVYQDRACSDDYAMQMLTIEINQSADIAPGLREYEKVVMQRSFQRQMIERILDAQAVSR